MVQPRSSHGSTCDHRPLYDSYRFCKTGSHRRVLVGWKLHRRAVVLCKIFPAEFARYDAQQTSDYLLWMLVCGHELGTCFDGPRWQKPILSWDVNQNQWSILDIEERFRPESDYGWLFTEKVEPSYHYQWTKSLTNAKPITNRRLRGIHDKYWLLKQK